MNLFILLAFIGVSFFIGVIGTGLIRHFSNGLGLVDTPGHRSSHVVPTPRGGGLAFVVAFLLACPVLWWLGILPMYALTGIAGAGAIVAIVGFIDDYRGLSVKVRLAAHFFAAALGVYCLQGLPGISMFGYVMDFWLLEYAVAAVYLVWLLNLYNFMDGIDGIASIEAITVLSGFSVLALYSGYADVILPLLLAASVAGFLCWNFPPAKIFMGDAGSGFLGIVIGLLSLYTSEDNPQFFWCWLILSGVFIVDATVTLFRRLLRQQKNLPGTSQSCLPVCFATLHKPQNGFFGCCSAKYFLFVACCLAGGCG
jgi:Fuc2NAc and GlcNAc transferase